jgi:hypothetical protein
VKQFRALYSYFAFGGGTVGKWSALVRMCRRPAVLVCGAHITSAPRRAGRFSHTQIYEKIAPLSKQTLYHLQLSQNLLDNWTFGGSGVCDASQNMWVAARRLAGRKSLRALLASTTWQIDWHITVAYRACDMLAKKNAVSLLCPQVGCSLSAGIIYHRRDKNRFY